MIYKILLVKYIIKTSFDKKKKLREKYKTMIKIVFIKWVE